MQTSAKEQIAYWNGGGGERWIREQKARDAMLAPFGEAAMAAAGELAGASVLDVGCGCGTTSLVLADRVGASGRVLGLDLSAPMIARATELAGARTNVSFLATDAGEADLPRQSFDVLYSRFGVMFFSDPAAVFAHLGAALRPHARVSFVCWRALDENPWAKVPADAVASVVGRPHPSPPDAPGPFSFASEQRVQTLLEKAGYFAIELKKFNSLIRYEGPPNAAAENAATLGPAARMLIDVSEEMRRTALAAIRQAIQPYLTNHDGQAPAAVWLVTAGRTP